MHESAMTTRGALLRVALTLALVLVLDLGLPGASGSLVAQQTAPAGDSGGRTRSGDAVFNLTTVHQIQVAVARTEWDVLQTSSARGSAVVGGTEYVQADGRLVHIGSGFRGVFPWAHAALRVNGARFTDVGLRYKGNSSFSSSSAAAPLRANFKVKLDLFDAKADWDGLETLNLHAGVLDQSLIREAFAYTVLRRAGVPASRTAYADLVFTVPGVYQDAAGGRFVLIENVNRQFLRNALPPGTGLLMKPEGLRGGVVSLGGDWASYLPAFRPDREATPHEQRRVIEFAQLVSSADVPGFRAAIDRYLDVDAFLRYIATNAFLGNWDSYLGGSHNFYLYLDPTDDRFRFIPWDEDLSLGSRMNQGVLDFNLPLARGDQPLIRRLLDDPATVARYRAILRSLATSTFRRSELYALIDLIESVVGPQGSAIRSFIDGRVTSLEQTMAAWPPNP